MSPYLQVIEAGANAIVAGSAVFGAPDYAEGMVSSQCHNCSSVSFHILNLKFHIGSGSTIHYQPMLNFLSILLAILQLSKESRPAKDL